MRKKLNNEKGITLIALVITIIVMLILVGVTIRISQNGNLFKHAANAASKTKIAAEGENQLSSGNIGGKSIEQIVSEQTGTVSSSVTTIHFTIFGDDNEYEVPAGTTWGEWAEEQENYNVTSANRINRGAEKGNHVMINGEFVDALSAIESGAYDIG